MTIGIAMLAIATMVAFMVESITEYGFGKIVENIPALKPYSWLLMYIAMAIGIGGAWVYQFDLIYWLGKFMEEVLTVQVNLPSTWYGITITGIAIGRGANYMHDLASKYFVKPSVS